MSKSGLNFSQRAKSKDTATLLLKAALIFTSLLTTSATKLRRQRGIPPDTQDPFHTFRALTSRAVITIEGRDPERQLTTYRARDGDPTSQFEFGFPLASRRTNQRERMEIFEPRSIEGQVDRRVAIRHPWHDVYLTSDKYNHVRACAYRSPRLGARKTALGTYACPTSTYIYLESWEKENVSSSAKNNSINPCYKLRFVTNKGRNRPAKISYAHVTENTWEFRLQSQIKLITQALASATLQAWEETLNVLFETRLSRFQGRNKRNLKRRRRCVVNPVTLRDNLLGYVTQEPVRRELRNSLKTKRECFNNTLLRQYRFKNNYMLASYAPWHHMTYDVKTTLICHAGYVLRRHMRDALVGLADTRCIRRKKWGKFSEHKRRTLLDKFLNAAWFKRKSEADDWLIGLIDTFINEETSSFCFHSS
ncbi:unnamed protein product [Clavelina lepadiformis]|uniref:Uncharacterized protein n=1 Tax=Clavelina lepadiformis TaxID=159417 RepID=A0ABP0GRA4_CLALP